MGSKSKKSAVICIGVALSLIVPKEVRKYSKIQAGHEMPERVAAAPAATA